MPVVDITLTVKSITAKGIEIRFSDGSGYFIKPSSFKRLAQDDIEDPHVNVIRNAIIRLVSAGANLDNVAQIKSAIDGVSFKVLING